MKIRRLPTLAISFLAGVVVVAFGSSILAQTARFGDDVYFYIDHSKGQPVGVLDALPSPHVCLWSYPEDHAQVEIAIGDVTTKHHRLLRTQYSGQQFLSMMPTTGTAMFRRLNISTDAKSFFDHLRTLGSALSGGGAPMRVAILEEHDATLNPAAIWGPPAGPMKIQILGSQVTHDSVMVLDEEFVERDGSVLLPKGYLQKIRDRESTGWKCISIGKEGIALSNGTSLVFEWNESTALGPIFRSSTEISISSIAITPPNWVPNPPSIVGSGTQTDIKLRFAALSVASPATWRGQGYTVDPEIWLLSAP